MTYMRDISLILPSSASRTARGPTILHKSITWWPKKYWALRQATYLGRKSAKTMLNSSAQVLQSRAVRQGIKQAHPSNPHRHN
jgi:hypothetical protein